jgi:hypothetical protein
MTTTIVSQEQHIDEMTSTMAAMEVEFKRDQERIMQWAHESIEKLNAKNDVLANMLNQTRQQLRAMTYNMKVRCNRVRDCHSLPVHFYCSPSALTLQMRNHLQFKSVFPVHMWMLWMLCVCVIFSSLIKTSHLILSCLLLCCL